MKLTIVMLMLVSLPLLAAGIAAGREPYGPCLDGERASIGTHKADPSVIGPFDSGVMYTCEVGFWKISGGWSNGFSSAEDAFGNAIPLQYSRPVECAKGFRRIHKHHPSKRIGGLKTAAFDSYSCVPEK